MLNLVSFPGCSITKILKSANMKHFDTVGKNIRNVTRNDKKPMSKAYPPNVIRR